MGLFEGNTGPEASPDIQRMIFTAGAGAVEDQRHVEIDLAVKDAKHLKYRGQHTDDGGGLAVDGDRAANDGRVGGIAALPETVAQHNYTITAGLLLFRKE